MKLRQLATAILFNDTKMLMIKKPNSRLFDFEFWSGVGGHLEPHEINDPTIACLREIQEETGLQRNDVSDLTLRYILLRVKDDEIRQQYVYFGKSLTKHVSESDEGQLVWLDRNEIDSLQVSTVIRLMLQHFWQNEDSEFIHIGAMSLSNEGTPQISWSRLTDPMVF